MNEKIIVDTTAITEVVSNFKTQKIKVAPIANTDEPIDDTVKLIIRCIKPERALFFSHSSEKQRIPRVANADSQSDRSNTECGVTITIRKTEIESVVILSFDLHIRNKRLQIKSIMPARVTEGENPASAI